MCHYNQRECPLTGISVCNRKSCRVFRVRIKKQGEKGGGESIKLRRGCFFSWQPIWKYESELVLEHKSLSSGMGCCPCISTHDSFACYIWKQLLTYLLQCGLFRCQTLKYTSAKTAPAQSRYSIFILEKNDEDRKSVQSIFLLNSHTEWGRYLGTESLSHLRIILIEANVEGTLVHLWTQRARKFSNAL